MGKVMIRKRKDKPGKFSGGDLDTGRQLFVAGMVWDGNICSKDSRDHFVSGGYAHHRDGLCALTGKGKMAMLHPSLWPFWFRVWRRWERNPFWTDDMEKIRSWGR